jgi:hypothetical protein
MKVVMLDVDGVLNNVHDMRENLESGRALDHKNWNAESCAALAEIVRKTDAKIVISSTWRKHVSLGQHLAEWWNEEFSAAKIPSVCIGITGGSRNGFRGREVNDWLINHPEITNYLVLDDDSDFYSNQPRICVDSELGLRDIHVETAVQLLNGGEFIPISCMEERNPPVDGA